MEQAENRREKRAEMAAAAGSLHEVFLQFEDPRKARGVRHPCASLLTLAVVAMLAGAKSLKDIAEFGRKRPKLAKAMGIYRKKPPCLGTFHYLFKAIDTAAFEAAIGEWMRRQGVEPESGLLVTHLDGKTLRGSRDGELPGRHLLALYADRNSAVLAQLRVDAKTNEHKAALELLKIIPLENTLITGDAMFAQREIAREIVDGGGAYLLSLKDNQKTLKQETAAAFESEIFPPGEGRVGA
jgi:hypothetical protein